VTVAARIGTITGIAIVPGVSRNGRLYTTETIGRAVKRAQQRLDDADGAPLTMLTHHAADDDSTQIVGRITSITQLENGSAAYTADLADTKKARDIAQLVDTRKGPAFLKGVSIRGAWVGNVRRQAGPDGNPVETADDLELDGLDFTRKPGVVGARVDSFTPAADMPAESASEGRVLITESVQEALVTATIEEADAAKAQTPVPDGGPYADPGYQADKKKRYPIDTKARAKAAWSYVSQADNARLYTSAQLKRIKQRIVKALKGFGVQVATQEGWLIEPSTQVTEALAECWGMDSADAGNLYVSLTNGPTTSPSPRTAWIRTTSTPWAVPPWRALSRPSSVSIRTWTPTWMSPVSPQTTLRPQRPRARPVPADAAARSLRLRAPARAHALQASACTAWARTTTRWRRPSSPRRPCSPNRP
jgi:hypothetical protein